MEAPYNIGQGFGRPAWAISQSSERTSGVRKRRGLIAGLLLRLPTGATPELVTADELGIMLGLAFGEPFRASLLWSGLEWAACWAQRDGSVTAGLCVVPDGRSLSLGATAVKLSVAGTTPDGYPGSPLPRGPWVQRPPSPEGAPTGGPPPRTVPRSESVLPKGRMG